MEDNRELLDRAMEYVDSTNALEDNELTPEELDIIRNDIISGQNDGSFVQSLVEHLRQEEPSEEMPELEVENGISR